MGIKFTAQVSENDERSRICVFFPASAWPTRGNRRVNCRINGHEFTTGVFPNGPDQRMIMLSADVRKKAGIGPGDHVEVEITDASAEVAPAVPAEELLAALDAAGARPAYEGLPPSHRRRYAEWYAEAKRDQTRRTRLVKAVEMIRAGVNPFDPKGKS